LLDSLLQERLVSLSNRGKDIMASSPCQSSLMSEEPCNQ